MLEKPLVEGRQRPGGPPHHGKLPPSATRVCNPFNGETFIFTHVDEDANAFQLDVILERGGMLTGTGRRHFHPNSDEEFHVRSGVLRVMRDGKWHVLEPGEALLVPRGVPHLFRNGHDGETVFTARFRPASDFLRLFLNMSLSTARNPQWYDHKGKPSLLLRARALNAANAWSRFIGRYMVRTERATILRAIASLTLGRHLQPILILMTAPRHSKRGFVWQLIEVA